MMCDLLSLHLLQRYLCVQLWQTYWLCDKLWILLGAVRKFVNHLVIYTHRRSVWLVVMQTYHNIFPSACDVLFSIHVSMCQPNKIYLPYTKFCPNPLSLTSKTVLHNEVRSLVTCHCSICIAMMVTPKLTLVSKPEWSNIRMIGGRTLSARAESMPTWCHKCYIKLCKSRGSGDMQPFKM